jgi:RNA polymerase sigma-70 factor (ECF subfamily)
MSSDFDYYWHKTHKNGDLKAFEWIYKNTFQSLCFYTFQITGDQNLSEEIVQEIFVRVWNERTKIEIKGSFKSYLYQAAHNLAINKLIQRNTQKFSVHKTASNEIWQLIVDNYPYNAFLVEKLEALDTEKIIDQVVNGLPEQCQKIFRLSKYENKPNDEIATLLNISVNTVRTQIYRALEKIKEALEKNS